MYQGNKGSFRRGGGGNSFNRGGRPHQGQRFQQRPKRNPLPEGFSLYYMAVICPEAIDEKVAGFKSHMYNAYGCKAASKSPAHITIVPPFRAEEDLEKNLLDFVSTYNIGVVPFPVNMSGYSNFGDRVLFIDIKPNASLHQLEQECMQEFAAQFPSIIFGMKPEFNPHVTIATRDIPEGKLFEAKSYFEQNHPFDESFEAKELRLVKLDQGTWKIL